MIKLWLSSGGTTGVCVQTICRGPPEGRAVADVAVSVMDPVHVYYKFWMLHSGLQVHKSTSTLGHGGRKREADLRTVGIVKDTRLLFPY